jgi:hypothetical protein
MDMNQQPNMMKRLTFVCAMLLALSACDGDDGAQGLVGDQGPPGMDGDDGTPSFPDARFYLSNNGSENAGSVNVIDQYGTTLKTLLPGNNEGVMLDMTGSLIQAGDSVNGSIRKFCAADSRSSGDAFDSNSGRDHR